MAQQDQDIPNGIVYDDLKNVGVITGGMGRTAIYNAIRNLGFPQPYQVGKRIVRWKRAEVLAWLEARPRGTRLTAVDKAREREVA